MFPSLELPQRLLVPPSYYRPSLPSLANDIGTSFRTHPDFVGAARINIKTSARPKCFFTRRRVVWVCDRKLSTEYQMRCKSAMIVRRVVRIAVDHRQSLGIDEVRKDGLTGRPSK